MRQRTLAFVVGTMLSLGAIYGGGWGVFLAGVAARGPEAAALDGDPCCAVPGSWGAVAGWSVLALVVAASAAAVFALGLSLLWWSLRSRWPGRRVILVPLFTPALVAVAIIVGLLTSSAL